MTDIAPLPLHEEEGLLLTSKPCGIATHAAERGQRAFVEYLSQRLGQELRVCHRLDKETSGAIVFGLNAESSKEFCALFEAHKVHKRYLFVSDRQLPPERELTQTSHIKKYRGRFVSWLKNAVPNATTRFVFEQKAGRFSLWSAYPESGKPHQIRLHARDMGFPILGDKDHAGSRFPRLMLHAESLEFEWHGRLLHHAVPPPPLFNDLKNCEDERSAATLLSADQKSLLWLTGASKRATR